MGGVMYLRLDQRATVSRSATASVGELASEIRRRICDDLEGIIGLEEDLAHVALAISVTEGELGRSLREQYVARIHMRNEDPSTSVFEVHRETSALIAKNRWRSECICESHPNQLAACLTAAFESDVVWTPPGQAALTTSDLVSNGLRATSVDDEDIVYAVIAAVSETPSIDELGEMWNAIVDLLETAEICRGAHARMAAVRVGLALLEAEPSDGSSAVVGETLEQLISHAVGLIRPSGRMGFSTDLLDGSIAEQINQQAHELAWLGLLSDARGDPGVRLALHWTLCKSIDNWGALGIRHKAHVAECVRIWVPGS